MATEKVIPARDDLEEPRYGMNDLDSRRNLLQHVAQSLINAFPGISVKPRNGVTEVIHNADLIGYNGSAALLYPEAVSVVKDGKLFLISWHKTTINRNVHGIEIWNVTDGTRSVLDKGVFAADDVHVSFKKLHDAVYMAVESVFSANYTASGRVGSKILEYVDGAWLVRDMGIDIAPLIERIDVVADTGLGVLSARTRYGGTIWNNEIWIVGGLNADGTLNSVLHSTNGSSWTAESVTCEEELYDDASGELVTDDALEVMTVESTMPSVCSAKLIAFNGTLFYIGGLSGTTHYNDVLYTTDGRYWKKYGIPQSFAVRRDFAICEYGGYLWISGGYTTGGTTLSDVWRSTDGFTWTQVTQVAGFTARGGHAMLSFGGYLWIIGGALNVYRSTDGATWTQTVADAGMGAVELFGCTVYDNAMWVVGGIASAAPKDDVYSSTDGVTWTLVQGSAAFGNRYGATVFSYLNEMYVVCGYTGSVYLSSVYKSNDGITWSALASGIDSNRYHNLTATFVRRTDEYATLQNVAGLIFEDWETVGGVEYPGTDEVFLTGLVSLSGANLTGAGTIFSKEIAIGSRIRIDGAAVAFEVLTISSNTAATVSNAGAYSFSSVRATKMSDVGDAITTDIYRPGSAEGIEELAYRRVISSAAATDYCRFFVTIPEYQAALDKGATHIRIYRTLGGASAEIAQGLSLRYVADVALGAQKVYRDALGDDVLAYVTNDLEVVGKSAAPAGRYCAYFNGRFWIGGNDLKKGYWFASMLPLNSQYPQKYASLFDLENEFIAIDPDDDQKDTGCFEFLGNVYFCKERKIVCLPSGDLDKADEIVTVSHSIGVAFPNSIAFGTNPETGKQAVYFMSESGPAILTAGGIVRLLTEFRIKELWPGIPGTRGTLFMTNAGEVTNWYTRNRVQGSWYRGTYWLTYGDSQDTQNQISENKVVGLHYSTDVGSFGGFRHEYGLPVGITDPIFEPICIVPVSNTVAYSFSHKYDADGNFVARLVRHSDAETFVDTFDEGTAKITTSWTPRPFSVDLGDYYNRMEAQRILGHVSYADDEGLSFTISPDENRIVNETTYTEVRQSGLESTGSEAYRETEVIGLREGIEGSRFSVKTEKVIPEDGAVEIFCPQVVVLPKKIEDEFHCAGAAVTGLTFVVKSDAVPEEDAYPT